MIPHFLQDDFIQTTIEFREGCRHWIDYEIYDALDEALKQKYIDRLSIPSVIYNPVENECYVRCRPNSSDWIGSCICDCSKSYPKTLEKYKQEFLSLTNTPKE